MSSPQILTYPCRTLARLPVYHAGERTSRVFIVFVPSLKTSSPLGHAKWCVNLGGVGKLLLITPPLTYRNVYRACRGASAVRSWGSKSACTGRRRSERLGTCCAWVRPVYLAGWFFSCFLVPNLLLTSYTPHLGGGRRLVSRDHSAHIHTLGKELVGLRMPTSSLPSSCVPK